MNKRINIRNKVISWLLTVVIMAMAFMSHLPMMEVKAGIMHNPGDSMPAYSENWHFYCIDAYGVASNGVLQKGDMYTYVLPSTSLNNEEKAYLFWATLSMLAGKRNIEDINNTIDKINAGAASAGLTPINRLVTEEDLKTIIHLGTTKAKYPWLSAAVNHAEEYMKLGGIIGSGGSTSNSGKKIPAILQGHTELANPLGVGNNFTIEFDASGADADFIQKVPLKFSSDDGSWNDIAPGGWTYQKTNTSIIFNNPNSEPPKLMIQFDTNGTDYAVSGGFSSVEEAYEYGLQLWVCTQCCGTHVSHSKTVPLEDHQRLVFLELNTSINQDFFAAIAGDPVPSGDKGDMEFQIYRHEEEMSSTYNVQLKKYDHETGKPIANSIFKLYERFDDKDRVNTERDGYVELYEGGEPYKSYYKDNPVIWNDFRFAGSVTTDENGHGEKTINHAYHYDKTFCDGHPSPIFVSVPEEEVDEKTGEVTNESEIETAQAENQRLADAWINCVADCEDYASGEFSGVHFHWIQSGVNQSEIESVLADGGNGTPDGGVTTSASEETAYRESGCEDDCQATYDKFISMKYSYTWVESTSRDGYTLHDMHPEDIPIEVITTDSSENGANASFAGFYSKDITISAEVTELSASAVKTQRSAIETYQLPEPGKEDVRLEQESKPALISNIIKFFLPSQIAPMDLIDDEEWFPFDEIPLYDDREGVATGSNALFSYLFPSGKATDSNANKATDTNALMRSDIIFSSATSSDASRSGIHLLSDEDDASNGSEVFISAYNTALISGSVGADINIGPTTNYSHCNDLEGEGNAWRVYDHRTEGEIHVHKYDMELLEGESGEYDPNGDAQGDGTVEGGVYGLFAASAVIHPDGKTGTVYQANDLVAVGTSDKNGELSFMAYTEAPGYTYDYLSGAIVETAGDWSNTSPSNLYTDNTSYDDYTADRQNERTYYDNQTNNGNEWIGRPLLMGDYYVKELSRSEGFELSIGSKDNGHTNNGQNVNAGVPGNFGTGYAAVNKNLYPEGQISDNPTGEWGNPGYDEIFFTVESKGTQTNGFDVLLNNLPAGAKVYRLDNGIESQEVQVGTGIFDKVMLGYYVTAEHNHQYPKYNPDGSLMTTEVSTNYQANQFQVAEWRDLDTTKVQTALESAEPAMTSGEVLAKLASNFTAADFNFIKGKTERALRSNGKNTPKTTVGGTDYSSIYVGIFDAGVREGEIDVYGVSGVTHGNPASRTVYGSPTVTLQIDKVDGMNNPITVGDAILSVLDFYNSNSFYNYGGIHSMEEDSDTYYITVYASQYGNPKNFFVAGSDPETDSVIYNRVEYLPDVAADSPRYLYATYSNNPVYGAFGTYENFKSEMIGSRYYISARLITDAVATGTGGLISKTITQNVYYQTGEIPNDKYGNPIEAYEYVEQTTTVMQDVTVGTWSELSPSTINGATILHVDSSYTDAYGNNHTDTNLQSYTFRIVVPETHITLTQADINAMGDPTGWTAGDTIGAASYYVLVKNANVKVYLDYEELSVAGEGSYIKTITLAYPGQTYIWQDGEHRPGTNTRVNPVKVEQRAIKQQIKVTKKIDPSSYENTNSYSETHEDWFTRLFGSTRSDKLDNFRFKTYLKSNLERLYRDENGEVIWQDSHGNEIDVIAANEVYPELVNKIFTKVPHQTDPLYSDSNDAAVYNQRLYNYTGDLINEEQNPGYTAILETTEQLVEDGAGTRIISSYNYQKFFDAVTVANHDKWDNAAPTYTSHQPIGNESNRTAFTLENAKSSDMVRQFAIDYYLDDEILKLTQAVPENSAEREDADGSVLYSDELYDEALFSAIEKAENYLVPFFNYDLDTIYAIAWDTDGGGDLDKTTLSADIEGDDYYFNTSEYLPYGVYVVAEQQPQYSNLSDFANRHYEIDKPHEVVVPTVYASFEGSKQIPAELNNYYNYDADMETEEQAAKYQIRFAEEEHVIKAHNYNGDFEVYKHGLNISRITNGVPDIPGSGNYFSLTQSEYRPLKDYYNIDDNRTTGDVPYYLTEGQDGREGVSKSYRYSSVTESFGVASDVPYPGAVVTEDNLLGIEYRDHVKYMQGNHIAYDDRYAAMLVPYTVTAPASAGSEENEVSPQPSGESSYVGYAYNRFKNRLYTAKLRLEKLDSETHENILHDNAIFGIYAAKRDDSKDGDGAVMFYETDTLITGTKEFLEAMGATEINPIKKRSSWIDKLTGKEYGSGNLYTGTVAAGTPICEESDQIILGDSYGNQTVAFKAYSTVLDGKMKAETDNSTLMYQYQTVGYIETPQPLSSGVYVIAELNSPAGYARTAPIAIEIYSDKVAYYKEGNKDERVLAAVYENPSDNQTTNGNKPQDIVNVARVNVENTPITLKVEKVKESSVNTAETTTDKTVTYKISGRIDGTLAEIGNNHNLVYAYSDNGTYLGYAWQKGTLESLAARKANGEQVELVYEGTVFSGYGYVTRPLETANDTNQYVVGATMVLYDALELEPTGDTQDYAYQGLKIERNRTNNITRMYVQEGFAGEKVEFVKETDDAGNEYQVTYEVGVDKNQNPIMESGAIWTAETIQRPDTDILYYDLDSLDLFTTKTIEGQSIKYGYDRNRIPVPLTMLESDKVNYDKTDSEHSIFAFKNGKAYLEFVGGDFNQISYSATDKILNVGTGTIIYHIDRDENRDSMVEPFTGMAYILEEEPGGEPKVLVWPVNIRKDAYGAIIARDKITTSRIATVGENKIGYSDNGTIEVKNNSGTEVENPSFSHTESGYITGSWNSDAGEESHKQSSVLQNNNGQSMNDSTLIDDNNGDLEKNMNPVYDEHGLPSYYQRSDETYDKGTELYDRNGDFVRYQDADNLDAYNNASYRINEQDELFDGDETAENQNQKELYHRFGEAYIVQNVWTTSDATPNDPFDTTMTDGQPDILKRLPEGNYIMEELISPEGMVKGFPVGKTVMETADMQSTKMVDKTTRTEIDKRDGADNYIVNRVDMLSGKTIGTVLEGKGTYSFESVSGAKLALYEAERIYTSSGYKLRKISDIPFAFASTNNTLSAPEVIHAAWTTGTQPVYFEGLPIGDYLLEELKTPDGHVTAKPVEITIANTSEIQNFMMNDDHTKVEVNKYVMIGNEKVFLGNAGFTLYPAVTDASGVVYQDGKPVYDDSAPIDFWMTNDATDYTETIDLKNYPNTNQRGQSGFTLEFESMFKLYGTQPGTSVSWAVERTATRTNENDTVWIMEDGTKISVINGVITYPVGMDQQDMDGFLAAYDANRTGANTIKWIFNRHADYVSHSQIDAGNSTAFPMETVMFFETDNQETIRITIYEGTADRNGREFTFEYQYDYKQLTSVNTKACSFLTSEGYRRYNYLPVGMALVLVETSVPEGYAKADDTVIIVQDINDVQHYAIENELSAIRISKVSGDGSKEFAGNELALYKAAADGSLIKTSEYLMTTWITGNDGEYNESDFINGRIPEGYKQGDLRPHTITGMDNGIYYLVEHTSADFYTLFDPIKIEYNQADDIRIVRVSNKIAEGHLEIVKTDATGTQMLSGAVFEVSAHLEGKREPIFTKVVSTINGKAILTNLPVGVQSVNGTVEPYMYRIKEIIPPEGHAINTLVETFCFAPNNNGQSYEPGETAKYSITIKNEKTKIFIEKRDFEKLEINGIDGAFVEGAEMAIYELQGRDEEDNFLYDNNNAFTEWITRANDRHMVEGLVAGKSYLLVEKKAPKGYNLMNPIMFTVSQDGRKITTISDKLNTVTVNTIQTEDFDMDVENPDIDSIQSLSIHGRYPTKIEMVMVNETGYEVLRWIATGNGCDIYPSADMIHGKLYTFKEITHFSDGSQQLTGKTTRRLYFKDGSYHIKDRTIEKNDLSLAYTDGTEIHTYAPKEYFTETTIQNNVSPENPKIQLWNKGGRSGDALDPNQAVHGTVFYANTSHNTANMEVTLRFDEAVNIIGCGTGNPDGNRIVYTIPDVKPLHGGYVEFELEIDNKDYLSTSVIATIKFNETTAVTTKETPILQANQLTIYNELTGSGKYLFAAQENQFRVHMYNDTGAELKGSYAYSGSKSGILKSGDMIRLSGNEFITIDPGDIYKNIRYKVTRIENNLEIDSWNTSGTATVELGAAAVFTRHVTDTSEREVFVKGEQYLLTETVVFTDGEVLKTNQFKFSISEDGSIDGIGVYDKQTKQVIHKTDITTGEELPGTLIAIEDEDGNIIDEWISGKEPHVIEAELEPGKEYTMIEKNPTDGFAYEEEIKFTVNEDGTFDVVVMEDKPNTEHIYKRATASDAAPDFERPGNQAGAVLQILDADKQPVKAIRDDKLFVAGEDLIFTTTNEFTVITKQLIVDRNYYVHELTPPEGLAYAEDVPFKVSHDGTIDTIIMWDIPTHILISKQDIAGQKELPGGHYSIHEDENGQVGTKVYEYEGNEDGSPQVVTSILKAGEEYWLVEDLAPVGYAYTEAVKFSVSTDGRPDYVVMKDKETHIDIRKENGSGDLLGKAVLQIIDRSGTVVLEFETSVGEVFSIVGKLKAGETYLLHEKQAPSGYEVAPDIIFTVSKDGSIDTITMIDKKITTGESIPTPEPPKPEPPIPEEKKKIGRIEAKYESGVMGEGRIPFGKLPKTGVDSDIGIYLILTLLSLAGLLTIHYWRKSKNENEDET